MQFRKEVPELTRELKDKIARQAQTEHRESASFRAARLTTIQEAEDLYYNKVKPSVRNPFNESFPFMSGFVDHLMSEIDDPPTAEFDHNDEADYLKAQKFGALFEKYRVSTLPHTKWAQKDRWWKKNAIFAGYGSMHCGVETGPFRFLLTVDDYYDFYPEPDGGGDMDNHMFYSRGGIYKNAASLRAGVKDGIYDEEGVEKVVKQGTEDYHKDVQDEYYQRLNRYYNNQQDPQTHNYVGEPLFSMIEHYTTYDGVRYYVLAEKSTFNWVRVVPLRELYKPQESLNGEALWPNVVFHTHEEARLFLSKAPVDDAISPAKQINRLMNQELYNREKVNNGQILYDPEVVTDIDAIINNRPDGLATYDSQGGVVPASSVLYRFEVGELKGTVDLVSFIDSYTGQKTGSTPSAQGQAEKNKKVGIFFGEMEQVQKRIGVYNKSYREAWERIAKRFVDACDMWLDEPMAVKILGSEGVTWDQLTREDLKRNRDFDIVIRSKNEDLERELAKKQARLDTFREMKTVNPEWIDRQRLKMLDYDPDEINDAMSPIMEGSRKLLSEAVQAIEDIISGRKPEQNLAANAAYLRKYMMRAREIYNDVDTKVWENIMGFYQVHLPIAIANEQKAATERAIFLAKGGMPTPGAAPQMPGQPAPQAPVDPLGGAMGPTPATQVRNSIANEANPTP